MGKGASGVPGDHNKLKSIHKNLFQCISHNLPASKGGNELITRTDFQMSFFRYISSPGAGIMEADDRQVTTAFSPTVIPPSALDKPSIMKRYHRRRTTR